MERDNLPEEALDLEGLLPAPTEGAEDLHVELVKR